MNTQTSYCCEKPSLEFKSRPFDRIQRSPTLVTVISGFFLWCTSATAQTQCPNGHPVNLGGRCDYLVILVSPNHETKTVDGNIAAISVCNGWFVDDFHSTVDWGDGPPEPIGHPPGFLVGHHDYETTGSKTIRISTKINCNEGYGDISYPPLSASETVTLYDTLPLVRFVLETKTVKGGKPVKGTVGYESDAPASGSTVKLVSDKPSVASVPGTVTVAFGSDSSNFTIATFPVATNSAVTISACCTVDGTPIKQVLTVTP